MVVLSGYLVEDKIYESDQTVVFRALREEDSKPVILKVLNHDYPSPAVLDRFRKEYSITRQLENDWVIKAYSLEKYETTLALILEDIGGISVDKAFLKQERSLKEKLQMALQGANVLDWIHQHGIIHKDINPSNFIWSPKTQSLKLIDFGISTELPRETPTIWNPNTFSGTLPYISPEQTGRMNRGIDYRTDLYSFGVMLYQIFTGRWPFVAKDPLEMMHCHLARNPEAPNKIAPEVPEQISRIILKLMAKIADERYQSALGVKFDLERCLTYLEEQGHIPLFAVGENDRPSSFCIPEKLYGRESELQELFNAFGRACRGSKEFIWVSGVSGIGKSALIGELQSPVLQARAYFASGKFEQFKRNIPYSSLLQAFQGLIRQILVENEDNIARWRERLLEALGGNGQLIIDVLPELSWLIGEQAAPPSLSPNDERNRFDLTMRRFVKAFSSQEHPLVLFLDDLQWADLPSIRLIEQLATDPSTRYLLLIGAFRENEMESTHSFWDVLEHLDKQFVPQARLELAPLELMNICHLLMDTLHCEEEKASPLAQLCLEKTQGNAFFVHQFLKRLHQDELLTFSVEQGAWSWDLAELKKQKLSENVAVLMSSLILELQEKTQEILKVASCIGDRFSLFALSKAIEYSASETKKALWPALQKGILLFEGEGGAYFAELEDFESLDDERSKEQFYSFPHDKIQQSAYELLSEEERQQLHHRIGHFLLVEAKEEGHFDNIFELTSQLNSGLECVEHSEEKKELASLNLKAGKKAKASAAHEAALGYLEQGLSLLSEKSWESDYELTLALFSETAEAAYFCADFSRMHECIDEVFAHTDDVLEQIRLYEIQIQALNAQDRSLEAIHFALPILKKWGVTLPKNVSVRHIIFGLMRTKRLLKGKVTEELLDLPKMTSPEKLAAMQLLTRAGLDFAAFSALPELFPCIVYQQLELSIKYGNLGDSSIAYVSYGMILCGFLGEIDEGYKFGRLGMDIIDKYDAAELKPKALTLYNGFVRHWKEHLSATLPDLKEAFQSAMLYGYLDAAAGACSVYLFHNFYLHDSITGYEREAAGYIDVLTHIKQELQARYLKMHQQVALNFIGEDAEPWVISGEAFQADEMMPVILESDDKSGVLCYSSLSFFLCYHFGQWDKGLEHLEVAKPISKAGIGTIGDMGLHYYASLLLIQKASGLSGWARWRMLRKMKPHLKKIAHVAKCSPSVYGHRYQAILGEIARCKGDDGKAFWHYEKAIQGARDNRYRMDEWMFCEMAGRFLVDRGSMRLARMYLMDARHGYEQWGAKAKVKYLDELYPTLFHTAPVSYVALPLRDSFGTTASSSTGNSDALDLQTVSKAAQVISEEIILSRLLERSMAIVLENAGAQKGVFLLEEQGQWLVKSQATIDSDDGLRVSGPDNISPSSDALDAIPFSLPLDSDDDEPSFQETRQVDGWGNEVTYSQGIVHYVTRTGEEVVLHNASLDGQFAADAYIAEYQPKSILCTPLIHQGKMRGVLYLENNLTSDAFTPERLNILQMLSAQIAISIENARLYSNLQEEVDVRTIELREANDELQETYQQLQDKHQELQNTQVQLVQSAKMASLGTLVSGVAHELNNPANFTLIGATNLQEKLESFREALLGAMDDDEMREILEDQFSSMFRSLDSISDGSKRISTIVKDMRIFSRLDEAEYKRTQLEKGLESTISLVKANHGQHVEFECEVLANPHMECYPAKLHQVFMNVMVNACQAIHAKRENQPSLKGKVGIRMSQEGQELQIRFSDNGCGISEGHLHQIFEPFFTNKAVGDGMGLGLSIAFSIVEEHNGRIAVDSKYGEGTTVTLHLPLSLSG